MRKLFGVLAIAAMLLSASTALAGLTPTRIELQVAIQGLGPINLASTSSVSVANSNNVAADTIYIGAGAVTLTVNVNVPVTASTAINSITANTIFNQSGTFSPGGVTAQLPSEVCGGGPAAGQACNVGGGLGGVMGLSGAVNVHVIPNIVVIPVNLNAALVGQGGSTNTPFVFDAAAWTTGTGLVNTGTNLIGLSGSGGTTGSQGLTLVTPTFVSALGNLLPLFTTMTLTNVKVPEPGTLMLLGAGVVGLALAGRRRK